MAPKPTPKSRGKAVAKDAAKPAHDPDADFNDGDSGAEFSDSSESVAA